MLKLGVTGGIGSGKSIVCKIFTSLGVPVYYADESAKMLVNSDIELKRAIINEFGNESFRNSIYNTPYIASIVFRNKKKLQKLNQIVHPAVKKDFTHWAGHQQCGYIVHEAAILFESGIYRLMDYNLLVDAPEKIRINRVVKRDQISAEQVRLRLKNQLPTDKIRKIADWIIVNDEKTLILPQLLEIHNYLIRLEK